MLADLMIEVLWFGLRIKEACIFGCGRGLIVFCFGEEEKDGGRDLIKKATRGLLLPHLLQRAVTSFVIAQPQDQKTS